MKEKIIIILISVMSVFFITSCITYRHRVDMDRLYVGMTRYDVENSFGRPLRILAAHHAPFGYQEILEYRSYYGELYAIEFFDNELIGYERLYDNVTYYPPTPGHHTIVNSYNTRPNYHYVNSHSSNIQNRPNSSRLEDQNSGRSRSGSSSSSRQDVSTRSSSSRSSGTSTSTSSGRSSGTTTPTSTSRSSSSRTNDNTGTDENKSSKQGTSTRSSSGRSSDTSTSTSSGRSTGTSTSTSTSRSSNNNESNTNSQSTRRAD